MARKQYGVFTKPGVARRVAYSPSEAVQLTYDGWTRIADQIAALPDKATAPADAKADSKTGDAKTGDADSGAAKTSRTSR